MSETRDYRVDLRFVRGYELWRRSEMGRACRRLFSTSRRQLEMAPAPTPRLCSPLRSATVWPPASHSAYEKPGSSR